MKRFRYILLFGKVLILCYIFTGCGFSIDSSSPPSTGLTSQINETKSVESNGVERNCTVEAIDVSDRCNQTSGGVFLNLPDVVSVVEKVAPSVVSVLTTVEQRDIFGRIRQGSNSGSGVIFDPRGYILTNNHVIDGGIQIEVTLPNEPNRRWPVEVVGTDPSTDLAVLKLDPGKIPHQLVVTPLGDASDLKIGEWVVAIGSPLGFAGTVTVGIVSAKNRSLPLNNGATLSDLIQTDTVINPGNSGGPLINLQGHVVGINTAVIRGRLASGQEAEGIGFAVSTSTVIPAAKQLIENGTVAWPFIGVSIESVTPSLAIEEGLFVDSGVLIRRIISESPADDADMRLMDVIVSIDGVPVGNVTQLQRELRFSHSVGETIEVGIIRKGRHLTKLVTLEQAQR